MKHNYRKILLAISSLFLLVSCAKGGAIKPTTPDSPSGRMDDPESILDDLGYNPVNPINYDDKVQYYSDHVSKVEPTYALRVISNPNLPQEERNAVFQGANKAFFTEHISVKDNKGRAVDAEFTKVDDNEFSITPMNDAYTPGYIYTAEISHQNICFKDKSPDIRRLVFDVAREDTMVYEISKDVKYFDVSKVIRESNAEEPTDIDDPNSEEAKQWFNTQTYEFIYANDDFTKISEGTNFAMCPFKAGKPAMDDKHSYFGKFVSCEKVSDGYKVTYKNVDLHEIYKDENGKQALDVHLNEQEVTEFRDVKKTFDENKFKEAILHDANYNRLAQAMIIAAGQENEMTKYDVLTSIMITPSFSWSEPKFVFQLKGTLNVPLNKDRTAALYVELTYQYTSELSAGASYTIETFMGVPYWITAQGTLVQTVTKKFGFKIGLMRNFKPEEQDTSDMKKMVKKAYEKLEQDPDYLREKDSDEYSTSGSEKFIPIASLNFPIGGMFSFYISADIHITMNFKVLFEYTHVTQYTERVLSFTTDDGVGNTANTQSMSSCCNTVDILGEIGVEVGLLLRVGFCITGLSKIFGLGLAFEAGVYVDLKGMVGITFGGEEGARFVGGVDFDLGLYGSISAYIDILIFHPKYDFMKKRMSLFFYSRPYSVIDLYAPDELELTEKYTAIESTTLLRAKVFDVTKMAVDLKSFTTYDTVVSKMGTEQQDIKPLSITSDSPYLTINEQGNFLQVADDCPPSFTAHLTITAHKDLIYLLDDEPLSKTVTVHYKAANVRHVAIEGLTETIEVEQGKKFTLPNLEADHSLEDKYTCEIGYDDKFNVIGTQNFKYDDEYYDFEGFSDGKRLYKAGTTLNVSNEDIILTPVLTKITYYTATFYNGKGEVIKVSKVREFTDAIAPTMDEIMKNMDGYTFYGWDRDFKHLTKDISVYGIYYKVV